MKGHELVEGNICVAEECGVDDVRDKSKKTQKPHLILTIMNAT